MSYIFFEQQLEGQLRDITRRIAEVCDDIGKIDIQLLNPDLSWASMSESIKKSFKEGQDDWLRYLRQEEAALRQEKAALRQEDAALHQRLAALETASANAALEPRLGDSVLRGAET